MDVLLRYSTFLQSVDVGKDKSSDLHISLSRLIAEKISDFDYLAKSNYPSTLHFTCIFHHLPSSDWELGIMVGFEVYCVNVGMSSVVKHCGSNLYLGTDLSHRDFMFTEAPRGHSTMRNTRSRQKKKRRRREKSGFIK